VSYLYLLGFEIALDWAIEHFVYPNSVGNKKAMLKKLYNDGLVTYQQRSNIYIHYSR